MRKNPFGKYLKQKLVLAFAFIDRWRGNQCKQLHQREKNMSNICGIFPIWKTLLDNTRMNESDI